MAEQEDIATIPLVEERIAVSKKQVESGRLRVLVSVDEHQEHVAAELSRDEVEIRRVARNVPLTELPSVRMEGDVTIIRWSRKRSSSRSASYWSRRSTSPARRRRGPRTFR